MQIFQICIPDEKIKPIYFNRRSLLKYELDELLR